MKKMEKRKKVAVNKIVFDIKKIIVYYFGIKPA